MPRENFQTSDKKAIPKKLEENQDFINYLSQEVIKLHRPHISPLTTLLHPLRSKYFMARLHQSFLSDGLWMFCGENKVTEAVQVVFKTKISLLWNTEG